MVTNATGLRVRSQLIDVDFEGTEVEGLEVLEKLREDYQADQSDKASRSLSAPPCSDNDPHHSHTNGQTFNIPIRGGRNQPPQSDHSVREPSVSTLERHAHARDDGYTNVCGISSPAISTPGKKYNPGKGEYCCPRCGSNFTRPKSVKDHFPYCIAKCGNPQGLRFTDHPTMAQTETAIQRRTRASREPTAVDSEDDDAQMIEHTQEMELREMSEALYVDSAFMESCLATDLPQSWDFAGVYAGVWDS